MLVLRRRKPKFHESIRVFAQDESGVGVVEMILILVVLIALVLIFKSQLTSLVGTIFKAITSNANSVLK